MPGSKPMRDRSSSKRQPVPKAQVSGSLTSAILGAPDPVAPEYLLEAARRAEAIEQRHQEARRPQATDDGSPAPPEPKSSRVPSWIPPATWEYLRREVRPYVRPRDLVFLTYLALQPVGFASTQNIAQATGYNRRSLPRVFDRLLHLGFLDAFHWRRLPYLNAYGFAYALGPNGKAFTDVLRRAPRAIENPHERFARSCEEVYRRLSPDSPSSPSAAGGDAPGTHAPATAAGVTTPDSLVDEEIARAFRQDPEVRWWEVEHGLRPQKVQSWCAELAVPAEIVLAALRYIRWDILHERVTPEKPVSWLYTVLKRSGSYERPRDYQPWVEMQLERLRAEREARERALQELERETLRKAFYDLWDQGERAQEELLSTLLTPAEREMSSPPLLRRIACERYVEQHLGPAEPPSTDRS